MTTSLTIFFLLIMDLPVENFYNEFVKENSQYEKKSEMTIFIESKHLMANDVPPKVVAEIYGENNFLTEDFLPSSIVLSSLDNILRTKRTQFLTD